MRWVSLQRGDDNAIESIPLKNGAKQSTDDADERWKLWTPRCLGLPYMVALVVLLSALAVALGALHAVSENNQGIATSQDDIHYLWTYGPTVMFTIVAALWTPLDFRIRQLTPWKNMMGSPTPSRNSLFLDYLSPWIGSLIWTSLKNGHTAVVLALTGRLLTQLLIVLSTGLLVLQLVDVRDNHLALTATNAFHGDGFNIANVDIRQYQAVYEAQRYGYDYPLGTTSRIAYQSFNASQTVNGTITSVVDAFHMDVSCKVLLDNFRLPAGGNLNMFDGNHTYTVGSTHVKLSHYNDQLQIATPENCFSYEPGGASDNNFIVARPPPFCSGTTQAPGDVLLEVMVPEDPTSQYIMSNYTNITAVYCSTGYGISPLNLTIDGDTATPVNPDKIDLAGKANRTLQGVSADDVLGKVLELVQLAPVTRANPDFLTNGMQGGGLFLAMSNANPQVNGIGWLDGTFLATQAEKTMTAMAAQLAKNFLLAPAHEELVGSSNQTLERILVRKLSLGLMEAALCMLICVAAVLLFIVPRSVCPRDPRSIGGLATILASSETVNCSFQGTGTWDTHTLAQAGASKMYDSHISLDAQGRPQFSIRSTDDQPLHCKDGGQEIQWWIPFSSKIYVQLLIFGMPIALIAVLETLYQYSERHAGIIDVQSDTYTYYAWVYLPAMTVFCVSTLYDMIDENARIFQPYSILRRRPTTAHHLIYSQHLGKPTLQSLWDSMRFGHLATVATALGILIGGMLPVAVSGLFTMQMMVMSEPIQGTQIQSFSLDIFSGSGVVTPNLILYNNLSYPAWTYETLAFPTIHFPNDTLETTHPGDRITIDVPAARSRINCTAIAQDSVRIVPLNETTVKINITLPENVSLKPGDYYYNPFSNWNYLTYSYGYFGNFLEMDNEMWNLQDNGPAYVVLYGYADKKGTNSTVSAWMCSPFLESVHTTTTFLLPEFTVDPHTPPTVDETTARPAPESTLTTYNAAWDVVGSVLPYVSVGQRATDTSFDQVFQALVWAVDGVLPHELLNNTILLDQLQRIYGIVEAQGLRSAQLRKWNTTAAPEPVSNGTLYRSHQARLVQHGISTRILEAFLGAMLVCGIVASGTVVVRKTLPKELCSIGAQVSLLAGSRFVERGVLPVGSEWWGDAVLGARLDGWVFGMGWWGGGRRFGIDVDFGGERDGEKGVFGLEREDGEVRVREGLDGGGSVDEERGLYHGKL